MLQIILVLPREQQGLETALRRTSFFGGTSCGRWRRDPFSFGEERAGTCAGSRSGRVHDGVRPFVTLEVIRRCYELAEQHKAVIPVVDVVETLRRLTDAGSETVSRTEYKLVQTPQVFDVGLLKQAYGQEFTPFFTDDASVVEAMGVPVHLAEGNRENIKITTPFDLKVGSALL